MLFIDTTSTHFEIDAEDPDDEDDDAPEGAIDGAAEEAAGCGPATPSTPPSRVNRDLKHAVDVRPVYHCRRDRIKAHVLLWWLALLLIRVIENETNDTWGNLKQATCTARPPRSQVDRQGLTLWPVAATPRHPPAPQPIAGTAREQRLNDNQIDLGGDAQL